MTQTQEDRLQELTDKLENGIKELFASGRYAEYLAAMSKFHHYSFGNVVLIMLQCPTATHVAGYNRWKKDFGRQVKKGEHGISILCPCPQTRWMQKQKTDQVTGQPIFSPDGSPIMETVRVTIPRFKIGTVFDVSQTEGRELPSIVTAELTGEVDCFPELFDSLVSLSPVPVTEGEVPGAAKGFFSSEEQRIVLRRGMPQLQVTKTLVHELAHARLHDRTKLPVEAQKERSQKEVEAESIAYVVCQYLGLDTSDYSFGYVAGWSSNKELRELKESLGVIQSTAGEMISKIEASLGRNQEPEPVAPRVQLQQR